ncbi:MAG TPA: ABC transporter substrate-binding protein [Firmicutes bacterium]|nr:ABC transporter substrate-binding protein [Bacillota bacterium]
MAGAGPVGSGLTGPSGLGLIGPAGLGLIEPAEAGSQDASKTIRLGLLPDADSFPFIVAREYGFFDEQGVTVELIPFQNAIERDGALHSGAIDGAVSDILACAFARAGGIDVRITSVTDGRYAILASKTSKVRSLADLKGASIGLSTNTIIEYVTDRLLSRAQIPATAVNKVAIPKIPVRLQMLDAGKITAACLPEPLATVAVISGARLIATSDELGIAPGVVIFRPLAIKDKAAEIRKLYAAYTKAVEKINADPNAVRDILVQKAGFPASIRDAFVFPKYRRPVLPSKDEVETVVKWLKDKGLVKKDLSYEDMCREP